MSTETITVDCIVDSCGFVCDHIAALEAARQARIDAVGFDYAAAPKEKAIACNLCGSQLLTDVDTKDRYGFDVGLSLCNCCGLVFINPRMSPDQYADFYQGTYRALVSAHTGRPYNAAELEVSAAQYSGFLLQILAEYMVGRIGQELLDIGGSTGVTAAALKGAFGLGRTMVMDPCQAELALAQKRGCLTIHGTAEALTAKNGPVDVICMLQTADHLLDIAGTLKTIRALLAKNGLFVADIVNFQTMLSRYGLQAATKIDHPYSLTQETFESYLLQAGFVIAQAFTSEDERHVFYICRPGEPQPNALPDEGYPARMLAQLTQGTN